MGRQLGCEFLRLVKGDLRGVAELRLVLFVLILISAAFFALCWEYYPKANGFSLLEHTISHFGSPDLHRNPTGFWFFRFGFASLCLLIAICVSYRHRLMKSFSDKKLMRATRAYMLGTIFLVVGLALPDSKQLFLGIFKFKVLHGGVVIIGIICLAVGIISDFFIWERISKNRDFRLQSHYLRKSMLLPFGVFSFLLFVGLGCLSIWEIRCAYDETLDHWPGEGIFSTALWEWIMFFYLVFYVCCFSLRLPAATDLVQRRLR